MADLKNSPSTVCKCNTFFSAGSWKDNILSRYMRANCHSTVDSMILISRWSVSCTIFRTYITCRSLYSPWCYLHVDFPCGGRQFLSASVHSWCIFSKIYAFHQMTGDTRPFTVLVPFPWGSWHSPFCSWYRIVFGHTFACQIQLTAQTLTVQAPWYSTHNFVYFVSLAFARPRCSAVRSKSGQAKCSLWSDWCSVCAYEIGPKTGPWHFQAWQVSPRFLDGSQCAVHLFWYLFSQAVSNVLSFTVSTRFCFFPRPHRSFSPRCAELQLGLW